MLNISCLNYLFKLFSDPSQSEKLRFFKNSNWVDPFIQDQFPVTEIVEQRCKIVRTAINKISPSVVTCTFPRFYKQSVINVFILASLAHQGTHLANGKLWFKQKENTLSPQNWQIEVINPLSEWEFTQHCCRKNILTSLEVFTTAPKLSFSAN